MTTSSNVIVAVNEALYAALNTYINPKPEDPENEEPSAGVDIRFDLPQVDSTQSSPTVSVFLYDVHEDLQLRQSQPARLNAGSGMLRAGWVNLNCNYLITYWETQSAGSDGNGPDSSPDNQAVRVMTRALQALLNNRELDGIAGSYSRIIPPQENLNSLGNFWQSLGNRPRLSLMYSVTVPILLDNSLPQTLVKSVSNEIVQAAAVDMNALGSLLWKTLCEQMGTGAEQKLARVTLKCRQKAADEGGAFAVTINLALAGMMDKDNQSNLEAILKRWESSQEAVTEINGGSVYISEINRDKIVFI
ncbi:DUF4255 domain-containing protein [Serratia inhibens]|nr:DUF4255 domain-containing protein [Serratia inhibens]